MPSRPQGPQAGPDADAYQAAEDERHRLLFEQIGHLSRATGAGWR